MKQTFRLQGPLWQMRYSIAIVIVVLVIVIVTSHPGAIVIAVLAAAGLLWLLAALWLITRSRLEITDTTVAYRGLGWIVSTPWSRVIGYDTRVNGPTHCEALILAEPCLQANAAMVYFEPLFVFTSGSASIKLARTDPAMIPVSLFDRDWRHGAIGKLVQQHAPRGLQPTQGRDPGLDPFGGFGVG